MPHTSTGTVRVTITTAAGGNSVVFVPDHDHSVQNDGGRYASFADIAGAQHQLLRERRHAVFFEEGGVNHQVWVLDPDIGGVELQLPIGDRDILAAAQAAATTGTKVKIIVERLDWFPITIITSITLPA